MRQIKWSKVLVVICLFGIFVTLSGCLGLLDTSPSGSQQSPESQQKSKENSNSAGNSAGSSAANTNRGNDFSSYLKGHELELVGNPVLGSYTTTSGCKVEFQADGTYRWEESGEFLLGRYELYSGTPKSVDDYVFESDTGPVYTVVVYYDDPDNLAPNQVSPASELSLFVYDTFSADVFRVTDLMHNIWFEATRNK